jgi:hypothetical protein
MTQRNAPTLDAASWNNSGPGVMSVIPAPGLTPHVRLQAARRRRHGRGPLGVARARRALDVRALRQRRRRATDRAGQPRSEPAGNPYRTARGQRVAGGAGDRALVDSRPRGDPAVAKGTWILRARYSPQVRRSRRLEWLLHEPPWRARSCATAAREPAPRPGSPLWEPRPALRCRAGP